MTPVLEDSLFFERVILGKAVIGFIGNLRGDDAVSRELLLMLIKRLCTGYQNKEQKIVKLLQKTRVIFVPAVDVDGYSFFVSI